MVVASASIIVTGWTPTGPASSATPSPRNAAEFEQLFEQINNWNRWGANDQLGAANLITERKRRQALALARAGRTVSLTHPLLIETAADNPEPFEHILAAPFSSDTYKMSYHGLVQSHLDALCHFAHKGRTYNGYPAAEVNTARGCTRLGVENLTSGVLTRGVLIDIPRLRGVPYLEPGAAVLVEDLEAWEKKSGVRISAGDAIFLRTGRWARRAKSGPWPLSEGFAGFHASVAPWFKARGIAVAGSDAVLDVVPSQVDGVFAPLHELTIAALGIVILDNQNLEALAQEAERLKRWEFLLSFAPLAVTGGTGSPVNALAIF